jgi:tetratricopeptide (TPR) repeat protein
MAAEKERNEVGYAEPPTCSRPESESLGFAYLRARDFQKASAAFQQELEERPNSGHALYGIAMSYELAGDRAEERQAWTAFLGSWKYADPDLPMVKHARAALR